MDLGSVLKRLFVPGLKGMCAWVWVGVGNAVVVGLRGPGLDMNISVSTASCSSALLVVVPAVGVRVGFRGGVDGVVVILLIGCRYVLTMPFC